MSDDRQIVFWDTSPDAESLYHTTIRDAVLAFFRDFVVHPEQLTVYGYARIPKPPPEPFAEGFLERILDDLDSEGLGDPEEATEPTEAMKAAALVFARVVIDEYTVWACEVVETRTVNVAEVMG